MCVIGEGLRLWSGAVEEPRLNQEAFVSHANAALTPRGRLRLARLIVDEGWPIPRAAERYQVSWPTAKRWAERYRHEGPAGIAGRLGMPASTVHAVLVRCRLNRLSHLDRATGEQIRRYEHDHPGAMIHVD